MILCYREIDDEEKIRKNSDPTIVALIGKMAYVLSWLLWQFFLLGGQQIGGHSFPSPKASLHNLASTSTIRVTNTPWKHNLAYDRNLVL